MFLGGLFKRGLHATRCLSLGAAREVSTLSTGYRSLLDALAKAKSPAVVSKAVYEFENDNSRIASGSVMETNDPGVASFGGGSRDVSIEASASSEFLSPASQALPPNNMSKGYATNFWDAVLNVIRLRITDVAVWSVLLEHDSYFVDNMDFDAINGILHKVDRFICRNPIVLSKVDRMVAALLRRVNALASHELNQGLIDVKMQPKRGCEYGALRPQAEASSSSAAYDDDVKNLDRSLEESSTGEWCSRVLDVESVWKLWYLLNASDKVRDKNTEQLLLEVLVSRSHDISSSFDLGRTLRSMKVVFQRHSPLSLVEEKLVTHLFRRLCMVFGMCNNSKNHDSRSANSDDDVVVVTGGNDRGTLSPRADDSTQVSINNMCRNACSNGVPSLLPATPLPTTVKQGNLYLTIGHVRSTFEVLSSMYRRLSVDSFTRLLSSTMCIKGLECFVSMAESVVVRSLAFEARCLRGGDGITSSRSDDETMLPPSVGMSEEVESPYKGIVVVHGRVLNAMTDMVKSIDHVCRLNGRQQLVTFQSLRNSVARLCYTMFGTQSIQLFDFQLYSLYARCAHYLLLSSVANGKCSIDDIQKMVSWIHEMMKSMINCISVYNDGDGDYTTSAQLVGILVWVDKFIALLDELGIGHSIALQDLVDVHRKVLMSLSEVYVKGTVGCGTINDDNGVLLLKLMQNHRILSSTILLAYLRRGISNAGTELRLWSTGRDIAMLCDVLTEYSLELADGGSIIRVNSQVVASSCSGTCSGLEDVNTSICQFLTSVVVSSVPSAPSSEATLNSLNNEQLLSIARCYSVYFGRIHDALDNELQRRCAGINFRQCMECLMFASKPLIDMVMQRISHMLSQQGTSVVDISPALYLLCDNVDAFMVPSDDKKEAIGGTTFELNTSTGQRNRGISPFNNDHIVKVPRDVAQWLLSVITAVVDRDVVILSDVEYLKRRLEKRIHRAVGMSFQHGGTGQQDKVLLIASHKGCSKFIDMYEYMDDVKHSKFYSCLKAGVK